MKIITNTDNEFLACQSGFSALFWLGAPVVLLSGALASSDVELSGIQSAILLLFMGALLLVILTKVEWVTLRLDRLAQVALIRRRSILRASSETIPLDQIISVRSDAVLMETGSKLYRLVILVRNEKQQQALPLVRIARDWGAQEFAEEFNRWLTESRRFARPSQSYRRSPPAHR